MAFWQRLRQRAFLGGFVASLFTPLAACDPGVRPRGALPVGVRELTLEGERGGEHFRLPAVIWYPTTAACRETQQRYDAVFLGSAATNGELAPSHGRRPVVVLAHGLRGTRYDLSWLAERLAQAGYLAVAIEHPGVSAQDYDKVLAPQVWRRAAQLSAALTALAHHPAWGEVGDFDHVAAIGHSAGGSAVLALAGAQVDAERFLRRYPNAGPVPKVPYADARFAAVVGLAPGTAKVFADAGIAAVGRPTLLVSGDKDWLTPEKDNAARYAKLVPKARWERLAGTGHFVFKPVCSLYGKIRARGICNDGSGVDRAAVHEQVSRWVRLFLAQALAHGEPAPAEAAPAAPGQ